MTLADQHHVDAWTLYEPRTRQQLMITCSCGWRQTDYRPVSLAIDDYGTHLILASLDWAEQTWKDVNAPDPDPVPVVLRHRRGGVLRALCRNRPGQPPATPPRGQHRDTDR